MAKRVDFFETIDGGGQHVVLTVEVRGGQLAVVAGDRRGFNAAEAVDLIQRIPGYQGVTPKDGDRFLEALHLAYSGSRWRATRPYEPPAATGAGPRPAIRAAPGQS